jgi:hypothetical protein
LQKIKMSQCDYDGWITVAGLGIAIKVEGIASRECAGGIGKRGTDPV